MILAATLCCKTQSTFLRWGMSRYLGRTIVIAARCASTTIVFPLSNFGMNFIAGSELQEPILFVAIGCGEACSGAAVCQLESCVTGTLSRLLDPLQDPRPQQAAGLHFPVR